LVKRLLVAVVQSSVLRVFIKIRRDIAEEAQKASPFDGTVEVNENYVRSAQSSGQ